MSDPVSLRSYQSILGSMVSKLLAETDINDLFEGSGNLTLLEAAATSDFITEGKLLQILNAYDVDKIKGIKLRNLARQLSLKPEFIGAAPAIVSLTITDTAFNKISSTIYTGSNAPIAGDSVLNVVDASSFSASGTVYVARNTSTFEAVTYTSKTNHTTYWSLNLAAPLAKDHLVGEEVVLGQGGDRQVPVGTVASTQAGSGSAKLDYLTLNSAVLLDGESVLPNVLAKCTTLGSVGRVGRNRVSFFASPPWSTASVTNPEPATGGVDAETDAELRQRIKDHVHKLSRGTDRAIITAVKDVTDSDENKRVVSAILKKPTQPGKYSILYFDDGTGYAPPFSGVGEETLLADAQGVEQDFQLQQAPLVKAQIVSLTSEPFNLSGGESIAFESDSQIEQWTIPVSSFRVPGAATAQELAEAINTLFTIVEARAKDGLLFVNPTADDPEYIKSVAVSAGNDAADVIGFQTEKSYTLRLYESDRLMSKNGVEAILTTKPSTQWTGLGSSETLTLTVDGVPLSSVTVTDADFLTYSSSLTIVGAAPADWAEVINAKFVGVTAIANPDNTFSIKSNRGKSSKASLAITAGSLTSKIFGAIISSQGADPEYTLNRLTGSITTLKKRPVGSNLKAGSANTRAYADSSQASSFNLPTVGGLASQLVIVPDAPSTILSMAQSGSLTFSAPGGNVQKIVSSVGDYFVSLQEGDWVHLFNLTRNALLKVYRTYTTSSGKDTVELFDPNPQAGGPVTLNGSTNLLSAFRTQGRPQLITLPSGTGITSAALVSSINSQLEGATATALQGGAVRLQTDRYSNKGALSIPVITWSAKGVLGFVTESVPSTDPQIAAIESDDLAGYPSQSIAVNTADLSTPFDTFTASGTPFARANANRPLLTYFGSAQTSFRYPLLRSSTSVLTLRDNKPAPWVEIGQDVKATATDGVQLGESDNLVFLIDQNAAQKNFSVPMWIDGVISNSFSPTTTTFDGEDSTGKKFGIDSKWSGFGLEDYRIWFRARADIASANSNTSIRIRSNKYGPNGQKIRFGYVYPTVPSQSSAASSLLDSSGDYINASVALASAAPLTIGTASSQVVYVDVSGGGPYTFVYRFVDPVDLSGVVLNTMLVSPTGSEFNSANRKPVLVTGTSNLRDATKTYSTSGSSTTVTISAAPSFTIAAGDLIQVNGSVRKITAVASQTSVTVDSAIDLTGGYSGTVSRITVTGTRQTNGTSEKVTLLASSSIQIFGVGGETASTLLALINNTAQTSQLITASLSSGSDGTGLIYKSTEDQLGTGSLYVTLQNGESYVETLAGTSPAITLKEAIDVAPEVGEAFRFIPASTKNINDHLSKKSITGLTVAADTAIVDGGRRVQISTKTVGGAGQVYVTGGKAAGNSLYLIRGNPQVMSSTRGSIEMDSSVLSQLSEGHLIKFSQAGKALKAWPGTTPNGSDTISISMSSTTATCTLSQNFVGLRSFTHTGTVIWSVRKLSRNRVRYEKYSGTASIPGALLENDWVFVGDGSSYAGQTPSAPFLGANQGWFQIRETDNSTYFDVDNDGAVNEIVSASSAPFVFAKYGSARPGDSISIGSTVPVSQGNKGTFTITAVTGTAIVQFTNANGVTEGPIALSSGSSDLRVLDQGYETYRRVILVQPKPTDPLNRAVVVVSPGTDLDILSESFGAVASLENRLNFSSKPVNGKNGYEYWIGLKREAQRVIDGFMIDRESYPGYSAVGDFVEAKEPQPQTIALTFRIRTNQGVILSTISDDLKSRVLGYINNLGIGQSVIISEIYRLVQSAPGVASVLLVSPSTGTEEIVIKTGARARASAQDIILTSA